LNVAVEEVEIESWKVIRKGIGDLKVQLLAINQPQK